MLVDQPTAMPVRKVWAVIISGAIVAALQSIITEIPSLSNFEPLLADVGVWVQFGVMAVAGYMTKEKV